MLSRLQVQILRKPLTRSYADGPLRILSALPERPLKKIRIGKARPAIYYKFDTVVELSDGSLIRRRSQFPKKELRMITDQRNNPLWNPSRPDTSVLDAEARGKLSKFKSKFSAFQNSGKTDAELKEQEERLKEERRIRLETGAAPKRTKGESDSWVDILQSNYKEQKLGGKIAQRVRVKRKVASDAVVDATKDKAK